MKGWDPTGNLGPKKPLPDTVTIQEPPVDKVVAEPTSEHAGAADVVPAPAPVSLPSIKDIKMCLYIYFRRQRIMVRLRSRLMMMRLRRSLPSNKLVLSFCVYRCNMLSSLAEYALGVVSLKPIRLMPDI